MSEGTTILLAFIAGVTIFLGLPLGRMGNLSREVRHFLNAVAVGVLIFLIWDVLTHAWEPIDSALGNFHEHTGSLAPVVGYGSLFLAGLTIGLMSLVYYERRLEGAKAQSLGPGAMATAERAISTNLVSSAPKRLALMIAIGIGLHNFGEGLAIGGSAAQGEIALATVLVIGFALHNATEGFGIVAPLTSEDDRPSWKLLLLLGAIGGGPTFVGAVIGRQFTNEALSVAFLTLAAGSILYVVIQLLAVAQRANRRDILCWGILGGLAAGFITDMIVTAGGA